MVKDTSEGLQLHGKLDGLRDKQLLRLLGIDILTETDMMMDGFTTQASKSTKTIAKEHRYVLGHS